MLKLASGEKLTIQHVKATSFKMNGPFYDVIDAGGEKTYTFTLSDNLWRLSAKLDALKQDAALTARLSLEETEDAINKHINVGTCESPAVTLKKGEVLAGIKVASF